MVQETFVRTLERPPRDASRPLRLWLVRVAINLSRDLLRRRKRREYRGPWPPSLVPTDEESPASYEPPSPAEESPAAPQLDRGAVAGGVTLLGASQLPQDKTTLVDSTQGNRVQLTLAR